jgi:Flp pilus assembly protein TadD
MQRDRVAVAAVAIGVNLNILANGFVYDDGSQILNNPWLRSPWHLGDIFSTNVWAFLGPEGVSNYYRPLMHTLNLAIYQVFGFRAAAFHAASILFHAACCLLVLAIGERLGLARRAAVIAALLFAVHPIHTEAVAWIAANTEPVYACSVLLAFFLYVKGRLAWSALAFVPGLLMKETTVVLLPLLAAWHHLLARRPGFAYLWHLLPLAGYLALRIRALGGLVMTSNDYVLPLDQQLFSAVFLAGKYLYKLVVPAPFNIFHVFHPVNTPADWRFLAGLLAVAGALLSGWWLWRRSPHWFWMIWLLAPLLPVLLISRVGENVFAERYLYLPAAGFCWLMAVVLERAPRPEVLAGLLAVAGAGTTILRNADWHDDLRLYHRTLEVSPESALIRGNLGGAYLAGGRPDRALPLLEEAVRQKPSQPTFQLDYGVALAELKRFAEAKPALERARDLRPGWAPPWHSLGLLAEETGRKAEAEQAYREAIRRDPGYRDAHLNLGILLVEQGRLDQAVGHFRAAGSLTGVGKVHLLRGERAAAEQEFRQAVAADVNDAEAWYLLGKLQREAGHHQEAERSFREMRRVLPWSRWKPP